MKPLAEQNLYEILEVPFDAPESEIVKAWDRVTSLYGPGAIATYTLMAPDEAALLGKRLEEVLTVLLDPVARQQYDARLSGTPVPRAGRAEDVSGGPGGELVAPERPLPPIIPPLSGPRLEAAERKLLAETREVPPANGAMVHLVVSLAEESPPAPVPDPLPADERESEAAPVETAMPTPAATETAAATLTPVPAPAPAPTPSATPTATPTPTATLTPTATETLTPTATETPTPTLTPTATAIPPPAETPLPTATPVPVSPPFAAVSDVPAPAPEPVRIEPAPLPPPPPPPRLAPPPPAELFAGEVVRFTGDVLRRAREARGISIQQLCERTKITRHHIENLEADRYGKLPVPVYLRGILMAIAKELRLDGQKVARSYLDALAAAPADPAPKR